MRSSFFFLSFHMSGSSRLRKSDRGVVWRPPKCSTHKVKDKWQHYLMSRCQRGSAQAPFGEKELVLMAFDCVGGKNNKKKQ